MRPSKGRIVIYSDGDRESVPAIVIQVLDDIHCRLAAFYAEGTETIWCAPYKTPTMENASRPGWFWPKRV
jgi:hypothetical protein